MSRIELQVGPPNGNGRRLVIAFQGQQERHRDHFDTNDAYRRSKFIEAAQEKLEVSDYDEWLENRILLLADEEDARGATDVAENRAPPRERDRARIECRPIPASDLGDGEQVDWIWQGYVARRFITLLIGLWKGGKSTLFAHLIGALQSGGDLAGRVVPGKVLVITEEGSGLWARRRDDVGFGDHAHFDIRPFKCRPRATEWEQYIASVVETVQRDKFDLVIVDTWASVNPCVDENDAAGMMAAVSPLHGVVDAGAAVVMAHHPKKGDATEGQASRGSGALPGFVDTIIELRRFNASEADDRRRKLRAYGRFEETPAEVVIELRDDGYHLVGSTGDANRADRQQVMAEFCADSQWRTAEEICDQWPDEGTIPRPSKRTVQLDLNHGYDTGLCQREGKGARGDPYRYRFDSRTVQPLGTRIESETQSDQPSDDDYGEM